MCEATGLYSRPPRMPSSPNEKGKGSAITFAGKDDDAFNEDEDETGSLASDTEWEGWRRELEMDLPPKPMGIVPPNPSVVTTSLNPGGVLPPTQEEPTPVPLNSLSVVPPENIAHTDEEARLLTPIQRTPHSVNRKGSLRVAKRVVVDGIAGKGLIIPRTNAYASWTSFSSNDSVNSSYHSHEEYRVGEGSDTTANRKPRLPPLVTGSNVGHGNTLSRAKSATVFSLRQNVQVPAVSSSAPLSATMHLQDTSWDSNSPSTNAQPEQEIPLDYLDRLPPLDDAFMPGKGGGLGNANMFPPFADLGTTVTTITSGKQIKKKTSRSGSLRGVGWLRFGKGGEVREEVVPPNGQESRRGSGSSSGFNLVRGGSKCEH